MTKMEAVHIIFVFLTVLASLTCGSFDASQFCHNGRHQHLDARNRNPNHKVPDHAHANLLCDIPPTLHSTTWYRFTGVHDDSLTNECVPERHCGTVSPIWTNDTMPARHGQGKPLDVCMVESGHCCAYKGTIYVHNCGHFYIYYLQMVPSCPRAYCVGPLIHPKTTTTNSPTTTAVPTTSTLPTTTTTPTTTTAAPTTTTVPTTTTPPTTTTVPTTTTSPITTTVPTTTTPPTTTTVPTTTTPPTTTTVPTTTTPPTTTTVPTTTAPPTTTTVPTTTAPPTTTTVPTTTTPPTTTTVPTTTTPPTTTTVPTTTAPPTTTTVPTTTTPPTTTTVPTTTAPPTTTTVPTTTAPPTTTTLPTTTTPPTTTTVPTTTTPPTTTTVPTTTAPPTTTTVPTTTTPPTTTTVPTTTTPPTTTTTTSTTTPYITTTQRVTTTTTTVQLAPLNCYLCAPSGCTAIDLLYSFVRPCPAAKPYCMTDIVQVGGKRTVYKRCVDRATCRLEWYDQSSDQTECQLFDPITSASQDLECHFCCQVDGCNPKYKPADKTLFAP